MSSANFLEKLLDGIEVEWMPLGKVAKYSDSRIDSTQVNQNNYVGVDNLLQNRAGKLSSSYVPTEGRLIEYRKGDILIGNIRPYLKKIWLANNFGGASGDVLVIRSTHKALSSEYLHQVLTDDKFFAYNMQHAKGAKMPRGDKAKILEYSIPVPCPDTPKKSLEIQAEIVRILDAMTAHTAELTAELTTRKKQYNYYRDKLLSFEDGEVEWKELGEICRFINGRAYKQPELLDSGKYPVLRVGNFFTNGNWYYSDLELDPDKYCDKGDLLYAWSASFGPRIWEGGKVIYHYHIWKILPDLNLVSKKYLYYLLAWDTEALKAESGTGSTMMHIGKGSIEKRLVPVPSLKKQAQIVSFLDKFDALTASITEGLPREIELREKQYAYYRDLLLSFPQAQAA